MVDPLTVANTISKLTTDMTSPWMATGSRLHAMFAGPAAADNGADVLGTIQS